ncbi:putative hydrolase of the HAD superfamily [Nonomuraea pusilla]|uniref:Putative hydrolase of the HAD superfamily n=1 Tax=Nonomuraea pusilla TaxID=46177 RepID=A0A1H8GQ64_9ACTN|nr:putative hydrolase of the HAD superfamily [Nonomuraea pusilla]
MTSQSKAVKIEAVIFDIGGVLEITPRLGVNDAWEARLGLPAGGIGVHMGDVWAAGMIGAVTEQDVETRLAALLGPHTGDYLADLWKEYLGTLNAELTAYLRGLRPRCRTGIVSNSFVGATAREQAAYGFGDLVDVLVYSHEAGVAKPDPRIFHLACERLGVAPGQAVFLDDHEPYVEGARAAGLHAVRFHHNQQAIAEIEALLDRRPPTGAGQAQPANSTAGPARLNP